MRTRADWMVLAHILLYLCLHPLVAYRAISELAEGRYYVSHGRCGGEMTHPDDTLHGQEW